MLSLSGSRTPIFLHSKTTFKKRPALVFRLTTWKPACPSYCFPHYNQGNYFCVEATFRELEENGQIVFRHCDADGEFTADSNPNGALSNIAGICNQDRNVLGMMPHPERACEELLGSNDGRDIFRSLTNAITLAEARV